MIRARPAERSRYGDKDSFYAVDYAAGTASELGADMVKVNFPQRPRAESLRFVAALKDILAKYPSA